jgi:hypothetical protein
VLRLSAHRTVLGLLCHLRGLIPLHASCVRIGDGVVAFTGRSGIGKSSMAAALWRLGYPIASDDVCVIQVGDEGVTTLAAFPRLRLWSDGVERLALDPSRLTRVQGRAGVHKYSVPVVDRFDPRPAPIVAMYHLADDLSPTHELRRALAGMDAFVRLRRVVYRRRAVENRTVQLFADLSRIAGEVPQWVVPRPGELSGVDRIADAVAAWHK